MSPLGIDFTDVSDDFTPLPVGQYQAAIFGIERKEGQDSGKPYLAWTFKIQDEEHKGRQLFLNTSLQPNALWRLKQILTAFYSPEELGGHFDLDVGDLQGRLCTLVVGMKVYEGQDRNDVVNVLAVKDRVSAADANSVLPE